MTERGHGLSQAGESGRRPWLDVGGVDLVEVIFFGVSGDVELAKADVAAGTRWLTGRRWSAIDIDDPRSWHFWRRGSWCFWWCLIRYSRFCNNGRVKRNVKCTVWSDYETSTLDLRIIVISSSKKASKLLLRSICLCRTYKASAGRTTDERPQVDGVHLISLWPWPLTTSDPENFVAISTHMMNICGKFHWNLFTKYRYMASREIGVNWQTMDGRTTDGWTYDRNT